VIIEVRNINTIGTKLMNIKKNSFLSLSDILNLNSLIKKNDMIKNGTNIPICLPKNITG
tara:strand:+ start:680 stop:856 length:177 start_codon:yes stop_codon:yes gene_type:complete